MGTPSLSRSVSRLLLIGGDAIEGKVSSLNGYLANLLELSPEADEVVDNLYLPRPLPPGDRRGTVAVVGRAEAGGVAPRERRKTSSGRCLNSREFAFNH